jgi:FAD synthase
MQTIAFAGGRLRENFTFRRDRGRLLGFPTANLDKIETIIPKQGVYAATINIDGIQFNATTNIRTSPNAAIIFVFIVFTII